MCGILCFIRNLLNALPILKDYEVLDLFITNIKNRGPNSFQHLHTTVNDDITLDFLASVLWLQGENLTVQPQESDKSIFVYNGDVFGGKHMPAEFRIKQGDTALFQECLDNSIENINNALININGPYAFIYLNKATSELYFGRDIFGRRSLLIARQESDIIVTSVAAKQTHYNFIELPAIGIFKYNLITETLYLFPWHLRNRNFNTKLEQLQRHLNFNINVIDTNEIKMYSFISPSSNCLNLLGELKGLKSHEAFDRLLKNVDWNLRVIQLENLLKDAIKLRISNQPKYCQNCFETKEICKHSRIGVLFSGGLDCTILALLASEFTDADCSIDLLNVAFDRVEDYKTPDRITGQQSYEELKRLRPDRKWNFVEINITEQELNELRSEHICHLIYPLNTILDESLGCAIWFAARGRTANYTSPCRVLLVGMGADELFGGYTRHRAAFKHKSWQGLYDSLNEDWENIAHRNLGRDDRVVSDNSRQLRTPYLDETVVNFVRKLNVWEKTYPSADLTEGVGEKILLRCLGYHLGLQIACGFKKRALQFGSRIANKKENAHEISPRL